jgi:hypothetical protein
MSPLQDIDALLLLSLAVSSKRRPAELIEIIAATDLIQGVVPSDLRLVEAFSRLAERGLICARDGGFMLTPDAQTVMTGQSRKADSAQRIQSIKDRFSAYESTSGHAPIVLTVKEVCTAILAYRESVKSPGKNLLTPRPDAAKDDSPRPGQRQRKPLPARRRKG